MVKTVHSSKPAPELYVPNIFFTDVGGINSLLPILIGWAIWLG